MLFQAGVEEQLIMSRTGHQSLDGVRTYKRVPVCQRSKFQVYLIQLQIAWKNHHIKIRRLN